MIYPDIKFGALPADEITVDTLELASRLGAGLNYTNEKIKICAEGFNKVANYRYAYVEIPVKIFGTVCDFGFAMIESKNLSDLLCTCDKAILLAVTAGIDVDRLITRLEATSKADAFFTDSIASAAIESFCDLINEKICKGLNCTKRFSPGYGDLPLDFQKALLDRLNSPSSVGISLNSSLLMSPMKSITAIIGINK